MKTIFDHLDYKNYINQKIASMPSKGRGVKLKLAKHLNCQTAYISQVLRKEAQFSLEQAIKINSFFNHSKIEAKFFLLQVQYAKAGSVDLQEYFKQELDEILEQRSNLKERLDIKDSLDETNQHIYYSAWYYAAIHILLSIPEYQEAHHISKKLSLPIDIVSNVLDFLVKTGLAIQEGTKYKIGKTRIYLSRDSIQIRRHHTNWRNQSLSSIDRNLKDDMHFSHVVSMAKEDVPQIKEIFINAIEKARSIIRDSKEENLQVITLDFFEI